MLPWFGTDIPVREPVSAGTHLTGFFWAIFALAILWRLCRGDRPKQLSVACFGVSMAVLYLASTAYHALCLPRSELEFYRLLDHSAIYGLIAGTYTPIFFVLLKEPIRSTFLAIMWGGAVLGIIGKWTLPSDYYPVTVTLYLIIGGIGLLPMPALGKVVGRGGVFWGMGGAVLHASGGILDLFRWPVIYPGVFGSHELLHVLVIAGTISHFVFIVRYVVPYRRPTAVKPSLPATPPSPARRKAA